MPNTEGVLISEVRLITREYGIVKTCIHIFAHMWEYSITTEWNKRTVISTFLIK